MLTHQFAKFVYETDYDAFPEDVIQEAKERILDTLGAAFAGAKLWEYTEEYLRACRLMGRGDSGVLFHEKKEFSVPQAAMINSAFAHVIELDDGHKNAGVHCGAAVVMTALTLGNALGSSGKEILTAVILGYDLVYRLAANMAPYQIQKGFHPSGNDDTIGVMAVAGKLLKLNEEQLANGFGMAALYSAGLMETTVNGQQSKCIQVGNAAWNGLAAAYYAKENIVGTVSAFEGKSGFFHAKSSDVDIEKVCEDLGKKFVIRDTYNKLYPTCRHSQPAIESVIMLCEENKINYHDVKEVHVGTYQVAYDLTGTIKRPKNAGDAKFSTPYGAAVALREKSFGIRHLEEQYIFDEELVELAQKVTVEVDDSVQALYPKRRGAKVQITLNNGEKFETECFDLKGSPANPIGWPELLTKFTENAIGSFKKETVDQMAAVISGLEKEEMIGILMELTEQWG